MDELKKLIREVPDYPKPGILFYDLTTLLKDQRGFHVLVDRLCEHYANQAVDIVVGIEARGFIFAPALAYRLGAGFVPVRKPRKLPAKTASVSTETRIRRRHIRNSSGCHSPGPERAHKRRSVGHRRNRRGHCTIGSATGRKNRGRLICCRADISEWSRKAARHRRSVADSIRQLA